MTEIRDVETFMLEEVSDRIAMNDLPKRPFMRMVPPIARTDDIVPMKISAFFLTPLAFLIATLTMFLEVNTLYHLSRRHASAGGYYECCNFARHDVHLCYVQSFR